MLEVYMPLIQGRLRQLIKSEKGATAVEYGIMVAAIAAVIVALVFILGGQVQDAFQTVIDAINAGDTSGGGGGGE